VEASAREAVEAALATSSAGFGTSFLVRLLELDISYPDETCRIVFPVRAHFFNPGGTLHGGIIATIMDISMGHLLKHTLGTGGATLHLSVQYLRAVTGGTATCEGRFLRRGRSICYLESRLFDGGGALAAFGSATWKPRSLPDAGGTAAQDGVRS
jgi:uncharacterized protein (TIGR00369 family)